MHTWPSEPDTAAYGARADYRPIYAGIPWLVGPVVRRARAVVLQRSAKLDTVLLEQIAGIRTIKALGAETDAKSAYVDRLNDFLVNIRNSHRRTLPFRSATQLFESLVSIVTLLFGARWVLTGELTVGEMVAGTLLVSEFLSPVAALAEKGVDLQESRISLDRLEDGFAQEPEDAGGAHLGPVSGDIVFEDVSFRFAPTTPLVLQKLNLTLKQGEITAVVGRSGSGKTTIAQLILRLLVPEAGRVTIGGRDVAEFEREHLRRNTGLASRSIRCLRHYFEYSARDRWPRTPCEHLKCAAAQIIEFVNETGDINSRVPESVWGSRADKSSDWP